MKLVDAAMAHNDSNNEAMNKQGESTSVTPQQPQESSSTSDANKASLQDAKVIKGSVDDLMSSQEKKSTFAEYLMEVLNNEENNDVLQWMPCGTQFTITNHRKFTMERMPELFKIRNMSSFVRKLTRWGFSRVHEKETGNSDIFKHPNFQREKPELCKKIRCVNRATASNSAHLHHGREPHHHVMMTSLSESSRGGGGLGELYMVSPQRRAGGGIPGYQGARSPHAYAASRPYAPRVSPEYEKEMMSGSAFRPSRPGPPQVYSPSNSDVGGMTAAAEYELEQILLQRQQARVAAQYRQQGPSSRTSPPMGSGSERSSGLGGGSERSRYSATTTNDLATSQVVTAALETLQREGESDLDMSPREAMLRAVLHKRQQQRQAAQRALPHRQYAADAPPPRGPYYR